MDARNPPKSQWDIDGGDLADAVGLTIKCDGPHLGTEHLLK